MVLPGKTAAVLLALAAALGSARLAAQETGPAAADPRLMECRLVAGGKAKTRVVALGSPLVVGFEPGAGQVTLRRSRGGAALDGLRQVELAWQDAAGLRAVAVAILDGAAGRPPVAVLDLDFSLARLRFDGFGGERELGAEAFPPDYDCRRLN